MVGLHTVAPSARPLQLTELRTVDCVAVWAYPHVAAVCFGKMYLMIIK